MAQQGNINVNGLSIPVWDMQSTAQQIDDATQRVATTPGSGPITAGDIGAATAPLLHDVTLYVNGTSGSDSNPGTQSEPFKTIQAAVDSLPKNLGDHSVVINIRPGVYDEDVLIQGFYNGFNLTGNNFNGFNFSSDDSEPVDVRSLLIVNCAVASFEFYFINVSGGLSTAFGSVPIGTGILVEGCPHVVISNCEINGCARGGLCGYYYTGGGSSVFLNVCTISNCTESAIYAQGQNSIYAESLAGSDNVVGITAYYGAVVTTRSNSMTATTAERIYAGFINKF